MYFWLLFFYASDLSRLRQSTLCLHLSSDAGYHWNAQYQGLQSRKTTELLHKDEVGESLTTLARTDKLLYRLLKKGWDPEEKTAGNQGGLGARKLTKGFLSVKCSTVSFSVRAYVCKKRR